MNRFWYFLILVITFSLPLSLFSQTHAIDSLEFLLRQHNRKDTIRIRLLNTTAMANELSDNDRMYELATEAVKLAEKRRDSFGKAEGIRIQGRYYYNKSENEQAENCFRQSLSLHEALGNQAGISRCLDDLGRVCWRKGEYETARENFERSLKLARALEDHDLIARSLSSFGILSLQQGAYDQAKDYLQQSITHARMAGNLKILSSNLHNLGYLHMNQSNYEEAIRYFEETKVLMEKTGDIQGISGIYLNMGIIYQNQGQYLEAIDYFQRSIEIDEESGDRRGVSMSLNNIGLIYQDQGNYPQALDYIQRSMRIKEEIGDRRGEASCLMNMGNVYHRMGDHEKALEFFFRSLEILEEMQDKSGISNCLMGIGSTYGSLEVFAEALEYLQRALEMKVELGERYKESDCLASLGDIYAGQGDYATAMVNYRKSHEIKEEITDRTGIGFLYYKMGSVYLNTGNFKEARHYSDLSLALARELQLLELQVWNQQQLSDIHGATGNYQDAYTSHLVYKELYDSLFNEGNIKKFTGLEYEYNFEKERQAMELEQQKKDALREAEARRQEILRDSLLGGLGAIAIIVFLISYAYVQKKKDNRRINEKNREISDANEELMQLNEEIHAQKEEIEAQRDHLFTQNEEITASINYAQRIQSAMLPPETYIQELLDEVFILYKPRDIVSGDFYWIRQVNRCVIMVAADCTGHGVPGAFMSMLGMSFLTDIVQRRQITQANQILEDMRQRIKHALRQHGHPDETKDGIDMALCVIDEKTRIMQYAGANNPIYIVKEKNGDPELIEIKADRMPVGFYSGKDKPFTNHEIKLEPGDTFYLFSDGFVDQKGGEGSKKYMRGKFKRLLFGMHEEPMYDQQKLLEKELAEWIGVNPQVDDILIMGVRM